MSEHLAYVGGIVARAFQHYIVCTARDAGNRPQSAAMRKWRRVYYGIRRSKGVDIGMMADRHECQIAVREDRSLRPSSGAARIEKPRWFVLVKLAQSGVGLANQFFIAAFSNVDDPLQCGQLCFKRSHAVPRVAPDQAGARRCAIQDIGDLARMKAGVHRHCDETRMPDAKKRLEVLRAVRHRNSHAITRRESKLATQRPRQTGRATGQLGVRPNDPPARGNGRPIRVPARRISKQFRNIHLRDAHHAVTMRRARGS